MRHYNLQLFQAAATALPTALIALVVASRFYEVMTRPLRHRGPQVVSVVQTAGMAILASFAEARILQVLARGWWTKWDLDLVFVAFGLVLGFLVAVPVGNVFAAEHPNWSHAATLATAFAVSFMFVYMTPSI